MSGLFRDFEVRVRKADISCSGKFGKQFEMPGFKDKYLRECTSIIRVPRAYFATNLFNEKNRVIDLIHLCEKMMNDVFSVEFKLI